MQLLGQTSSLRTSLLLDHPRSSLKYSSNKTLSPSRQSRSAGRCSHADWCLGTSLWCYRAGPLVTWCFCGAVAWWRNPCSLERYCYLRLPSPIFPSPSPPLPIPPPAYRGEKCPAGCEVSPLQTAGGAMNNMTRQA